MIRISWAFYFIVMLFRVKKDAVGQTHTTKYILCILIASYSLSACYLCQSKLKMYAVLRKFGRVYSCFEALGVE